MASRKALVANAAQPSRAWQTCRCRVAGFHRLAPLREAMPTGRPVAGVSRESEGPSLAGSRAPGRLLEILVQLLCDAPVSRRRKMREIAERLLRHGIGNACQIHESEGANCASNSNGRRRLTGYPAHCRVLRYTLF